LVRCSANSEGNDEVYAPGIVGEPGDRGSTLKVTRVLTKRKDWRIICQKKTL
jgi:hypothetical protein